MNLLEYEAKQLLADANIPIPRRSVIHRNKILSIVPPIVLKSQVPIGGRGKAGGIVIVDDKSDVNDSVQRLFALPIKSFLPSTLLAEEKLTIKNEYYLSLIIDREQMTIRFVAHKNGGVEVEENTDFQSWDIDSPDDVQTIGTKLADYFDFADITQINKLLLNLYNCFIDNDATLIEINPLVQTDEGTLIAGDCKMVLDGAARFRHDWHFEDTPAEANFVTIDQQGNIATIANGAGLAMATVDAVYEAGLIPANFLDIGGGANTETLLAAFHRLLEYPNIKAIIINIFAGITHSDEVAHAIVAARNQITDLPPLFIRLAGTNYQEAADILSEADIPLLPNLESCLSAAREVINE